MASFNQVVLLGNLTREPELKVTPGGLQVCSFGLAVNEKRDGKEETLFLDVAMFARQAEIAAEYLTKGAPVLISGKLKLETWEKDGKKFSKLKVVGQAMQMLGAPKGERFSQAGKTEDEYAQAPAAKVADDDVPF